MSHSSWIHRQPTLLPGRSIPPRLLYRWRAAAFGFFMWMSFALYALYVVRDAGLTPFELLIVGDHCTDDTAELVAPFLSERVRWLNLPARTGNQSGPNTAGIAAARGRYVAYCGHDDIWAPGHVSALLGCFARAPEPDFAVSGAIFHMPPGIDRPQVTGLFPPGDTETPRRHFFPPSKVS